MTGIRATAAHVALATAERLLNPGSISGASLEGLAGTALMHARLSAVDPVFAKAADQHWTRAALQASQLSCAGPGIYGSPSGLAASLILGSQYLPDPGQLASAAERAVRWLARYALQLSAADQDRRNSDQPLPSWAGYDLISGPAGIGRMLLAACLAGHHSAERGLNAMLTTLILMITSSADQPGWWIPARPRQPARSDPSGEAVTGIAHGIAGPLAFLAAAHQAGYSAEGQTAAIRAAATWLVQWRTEGFWPPAITGTELASGLADPMPGRRDAWCYGTPGIARALSLAGNALGDPQLVQYAMEALAVMAGQERWDVDGPTICHGYAGVLQSSAPGAAAVARRAARAVVADRNPAFSYVFRHHSRDGQTDRPGLLTGSSGIALALADYGALPAAQTTSPWDCVLLLT
jgi:lantibiotic biosynthesis protein